MLSRLWSANFSDAENYQVDHEFETQLKIKAKTRAKYIYASFVADVILVVLFFSSIKLDLPKAVLIVLAFIWLISSTATFIFLVPWFTPKCPQCGKRMEKWNKREGILKRRIYFVCGNCKLKADAAMSS